MATLTVVVLKNGKEIIGYGTSNENGIALTKARQIVVVSFPVQAETPQGIAMGIKTQRTFLPVYISCLSLEDVDFGTEEVDRLFSPPQDLLAEYTKLTSKIQIPSGSSFATR